MLHPHQLLGPVLLVEALELLWSHSGFATFGGKEAFQMSDLINPSGSIGFGPGVEARVSEVAVWTEALGMKCCS